MMFPKNETPAAVDAADRGNKDCFVKYANPSAAAPRYQLAGSVFDRIVVLDHGVVVGWATGISEPPLRVHLVAPLRFADPALTGFRELTGSDAETVVCVWGAP